MEISSMTISVNKFRVTLLCAMRFDLRPSPIPRQTRSHVNLSIPEKKCSEKAASKPVYSVCY